MTLLAHWHELGVIGLVVIALAAVQVFLPGVLPAALKWIIGTEWGRALLMVVAVCLAWWWFRDHYVAVGRASVLAEQRQAADRAQVHAAFVTLDAYMAGAKAMAGIASSLEQSHADADAAKDRLIADLRTGNRQLQHRFTCPTSLPAAATGAGDGQAPAGFTAADAEVAFGIAADGDDAIRDLTACQATVTEYQRIGALKVTP